MIIKRKSFSKILFIILFTITGLLCLSRFSPILAQDEHSCEENEDGEITYDIQDNKLIAYCPYCDYQYEEYVSINLKDNTVFNCKNKVSISVTDHNWSSIDGLSYVLLFEGTGDTDYAMSTDVPTESGTYSVCLTYENNWEKRNEDQEYDYYTTPVNFTLEGHQWSYTSSGYSINAKCSKCNATASVTLDTSAVYQASRNCDTSGLKYDMFYQTNWTKYSDLKQYSVIYSGEETVDQNNTTKHYANKVVKPEHAGNYEVYLALLDNESDTSSASLKTKVKRYYVADVSSSDCTIKEYGNNEISQFTKPSLKDGAYQVGTASELLWCAYNDNNTSISLTNDIVINPITVTDDNKLYSASYSIYRWKGLGTQDKPYIGKINGNGYTVYGLYSDSNKYDNNAGLINCGDYRATISNLNIENSYINNTSGYAGAFFGLSIFNSDYSVAEKTDFLTVTVASNCNAYHNYIRGSSSAGGLIGSIYYCGKTSVWQTVKLVNCHNSSYVNGNVAGGIVGYSYGVDFDHSAETRLESCTNLGTVSGLVSGGILGSYNCGNILQTARFTKCLNSGYVRGMTSNYNGLVIPMMGSTNIVGGILGYSDGQGDIEIYGAISIGDIESNVRYKGSFIGKYDGELDWTNYDAYSYYYYGTANPIGNVTLPSNVTSPAKLTESQVKSAYACTKYGHLTNTHYSDVSVVTCTSNGSMKKTCLVCGKILETKTTEAHGHLYEWTDSGKNCIYCGEAQNSNVTASLFSKPSIMIIVSTISALVVVAVAVLYIKKFNKKGEGK